LISGGQASGLQRVCSIVRRTRLMRSQRCQRPRSVTFAGFRYSIPCTLLPFLTRRSLIGRLYALARAVMIDGRHRAIPADRRLPCARRNAGGRPRANAPPSRRSRRSAAFAPPAETGPFGRECYPIRLSFCGTCFPQRLPRRPLRELKIVALVRHAALDSADATPGGSTTSGAHRARADQRLRGPLPT